MITFCCGTYLRNLIVILYTYMLYNILYYVRVIICIYLYRFPNTRKSIDNPQRIDKKVSYNVIRKF